jgi:hypothetical protein
MKSVAITQRLKSLGRVSTLSCRVAIHGILKHTKLIWTVMSQIVCFRMLTTDEHHPDPSDGLSCSDIFLFPGSTAVVALDC